MTPPDHEHAGFEIDADPLGRPVNGALLGRFVGAAYDGCVPCQNTLLSAIVEDAVTTTRLVEVACVMTQAQFGGIPASMADDDVPGPASPEFRRMVRAGADDRNEDMLRECEQMTSAQRRAAAETAADVVVGRLILG